MIDRIPKDTDIEWATLQVLKKRDQAIHISEIEQRTSRLLALSETALKIPHSDGRRSAFQYRAHWARTGLKNCGLIRNLSRGMWAITDVGRDIQTKNRFIAHKASSDQTTSSDTPKDDAQSDEHTPIDGVTGKYSIATMMDEGCFLEKRAIETILDRLRVKKNIILQGPPGTGKTWLAKRLAYALIGMRDESNVRSVQFHPSLSYEDFVRGWRPRSDGKLTLENGMFMDVVEASLKQPSAIFAIVIEEINRGNPAQIFGDLLTLIDAGKRTYKDAIELCYADPGGKRTPVYIPGNLYIIGTMNVADRSLALVDLALRRRFAFITLEPILESKWRNFVVYKRGVDADLAKEIERRIKQLNAAIDEDHALGSHFRIGHSFVTPDQRIDPGTTKRWFTQVVRTEIAPQLEEYWFDSPGQAKEATDDLLKGW